MIDDNWDLINGEAAHAIEVLNYSNQVNVIEALVHLLTHQFGVTAAGCGGSPNLMALKEFHRTATLFLLNEPGEFRKRDVCVRRNDGTIVHNPPPTSEVARHMDAFFQEVAVRWPKYSPVEMGAYTLWLINWVHPFQNGNGRSARAFCYACLSLKLGFVLPGTPTVIDLIMQNREEYQQALKIVDVGFDTTGEPDLTAMNTFVEKLLIEQLSAVPAADKESDKEAADQQEAERP